MTPGIARIYFSPSKIGPHTFKMADGFKTVPSMHTVSIM